MKTYILSRNSWGKYEKRVSSNCKELRSEIVNLSHYIDPDKGIAEKKDINSKEIIIAPDGICSIKYLLRYYDGTDYSTPYSIIRNNLNP